MEIAEYNTRKAAADRDFASRVGAWQARPALPEIVRGSAWLAGILTTAAVIGFATAGPIGAMVVPVLVTLPALAILGDSQAGAVPDMHADAYEAAGLAGVGDPSRGPSILTKLSMLFGRRTAATVTERAERDLADGFWGSTPTDVRYLVRGDDVTPATGNIYERGPMTKIRITEDGGVLATHTVSGKLQAEGGRPSAVRLDATGKVASAAWHDDGVASETWKAGQGGQLSVEVGMLSGEIRMLADEIRTDGGNHLIARALDELSERALALASHGCVSVPLEFDRDGKVSIDALKSYLARPAEMDDDLELAMAPSIR